MGGNCCQAHSRSVGEPDVPCLNFPCPASASALGRLGGLMQLILEALSANLSTSPGGSSLPCTPQQTPGPSPHLAAVPPFSPGLPHAGFPPFSHKGTQGRDP